MSFIIHVFHYRKGKDTCQMIWGKDSRGSTGMVRRIKIRSAAPPFLISHSIRAFTHHQWAVRQGANHCTYSNQKSEPFSQKGSDHLVPEAGLEPARCRHRQILSLVRLPFRHSGISIVCIVAYLSIVRQIELENRNEGRRVTGD